MDSKLMKKIGFGLSSLALALSIFLGGDSLIKESKEKIVPNEELVTLNIPTYDGSGQAVHPSIIKSKNLGYLLAITPYPQCKADLENPQVFSSKDGLEFKVLGDSINPIDFPKPYSHNCDPCLLKHKNKFHLYYLEIEEDTCRLKYRNSKDCKNWSDEQQLLELSNFGLLSPSVLFDREYKMWVVEAGHNGFSTNHTNVYLYSSKNGIKWNKKEKINFDKNYLVWHLETKKYNNEYLMLFSGRKKENEDKKLFLYLAKSKNGLDWEINEEPLISPTKELEDYQFIYKSSFLIEDGILKIWYSAMTKIEEWNIGYTERKLD